MTNAMRGSLGIEGALVPEWGAPARVRALSTTRRGGVSAGPWGLVDGSRGGMNLGARCGDDPAAVQANRDRVASSIGAMPVWLEQVHGIDVHAIVANVPGSRPAGNTTRVGAQVSNEARADASVTNVPGVVLAVLTADCLPVLLADSRGEVVAAAHAGWRGLADGVLERTVEAMRAAGAKGAKLCAWLGPSIGPEAFEVGNEVRERFCDVDPRARAAFVAGRRPGKWLADLPALARLRLEAADVHRVDGASRCTARDAADFYSYRRDGRCGRMATLVWIASR
ncbi:MAG: peptidoglycan editing factor PgeF [Burkholderiaceae bacterium]|nr:peptidoglycan editing factor PgeF [Burkholderiaceae bacterium]